MKTVYSVSFRVRRGIYKVSILKAEIIEETKGVTKLKVLEQILSIDSTKFRSGEIITSINPLFDSLLEAKIYTIKKFWER